jgi:hypothetical protein
VLECCRLRSSVAALSRDAVYLDCLLTARVTKALLYPFRTRNSLDWPSRTASQLDLVSTETSCPAILGPAEVPTDLTWVLGRGTSSVVPFAPSPRPDSSAAHPSTSGLLIRPLQPGKSPVFCCTQSASCDRQGSDGAICLPRSSRTPHLPGSARLHIQLRYRSHINRFCLRVTTIEKDFQLSSYPLPGVGHCVEFLPSTRFSPGCASIISKDSPTLLLLCGPRVVFPCIEDIVPGQHTSEFSGICISVFSGHLCAQSRDIPHPARRPRSSCILNALNPLETQLYLPTLKTQYGVSVPLSTSPTTHSLNA